MSFDDSHLVPRVRRGAALIVGNRTACALTQKRRPCKPPTVVIAGMPICEMHHRIIARIEAVAVLGSSSVTREIDQSTSHRKVHASASRT
jgi:hypothetical protein